MNKFFLLGIGITLASLTACSKMPSECQESWNKMEKFGKKLGVPKEELQKRKKNLKKILSKWILKKR
ncbi:hypothetical protein SKM62_00545 [Acinetobacter faecalis]|uniref:hypothetical protein n=1 Tax=Acinetobacter TaxID=469 RepID=UPI0027AAA0F4|nr:MULTISPECIES: hypothetical protein [Acinetobacter]MDY6510924.1 hypothetical protein [Acinetobacter faecalis]MDY6535436.1 hypothetical protein [Acinetobacter faecalis]WFP95697.1 hypothetical protein P3S51_06875 [Acinetobacter sp. ANC 7201]